MGSVILVTVITGLVVFVSDNLGLVVVTILVVVTLLAFVVVLVLVTIPRVQLVVVDSSRA